VNESYWSKVLRGRVNRRQALAAGGGLTAAAAFLAACGGGGNDDDDGSGTGGASTGATGATGAALDPASGVQGGKFIWQGYGDVGGSTEMIKIRNAGVHQLAGLTHDALLEFRNGTPAFPGADREVQPNLAQALPEQAPDKLTYTFKLRDAKFHNGKDMTSEDVKWSLETYAFAEESAFKNDYVWLDSVDAPDPKTVVIKTKFPFADALQSLAGKDDGEIMDAEFQEGPTADKELMGTGPYQFVSYEAPVVTRYRRNPNYHRAPYPYFEELERTGNADQEKKIADFIAGNVHMSYWFPEEDRDRVEAQRPNAQLWSYNVPGETVSMRTDKAPFNDVRVRRAFSMAINREQLAQVLTKGEGEADQWLSWTGTYWDFRKPADLGENAQWFEHNVEEAKKLLSAAGITEPIQGQVPHWNPTVIGPKYVDQIVLIMTHWRNAGIADLQSQEMTHAQFSASGLIGNYEMVTWHPNVTAIQAKLGLSVRNNLSWAPGVPHQPPTLNRGYIDDPDLTALVQKQLEQFEFNERQATFREIEDILASEQYAIVGVTHSCNWFADESMKNTQPAIEMYNGGTNYMKYWWFDNA
jgi:ABC-type transport system substrate-binding protein